MPYRQILNCLSIQYQIYIFLFEITKREKNTINLLRTDEPENNIQHSFHSIHKTVCG